MSKTITVPDIGQRPIKITINNRDTILYPGTEQTVPDEVAALIGQIVAAQPKPASDGADGAWATLRDVKKIAGEGGGDTTVTLTETDETNVYTADMTVADVIAAFRRGPVYVRMSAGRSAEAVLRVYMVDADEGDDTVYATVGIPSSSSLFAIHVIGSREKGVETWQVMEYSIGVAVEDVYFSAGEEREVGVYEVTTSSDMDEAYDAAESRSLMAHVSTSVAGGQLLGLASRDYNKLVFTGCALIDGGPVYLQLDWLRSGVSSLRIVPLATVS